MFRNFWLNYLIDKNKALLILYTQVHPLLYASTVKNDFLQMFLYKIFRNACNLNATLLLQY